MNKTLLTSELELRDPEWEDPFGTSIVNQNLYQRLQPVVVICSRYADMLPQQVPIVEPEQVLNGFNSPYINHVGGATFILERIARSTNRISKVYEGLI